MGVEHGRTDFELVLRVITARLVILFDSSKFPWYRGGAAQLLLRIQSVNQIDRFSTNVPIDEHQDTHLIDPIFGSWSLTMGYLLWISSPKGAEYAQERTAKV